MKKTKNKRALSRAVRIKLIWLISTVLSIAVFIFFAINIASEKFKADIFHTGGTSSPTQQVYIQKNYIATPDESGAIEIKANETFLNVVGVSFRLKWNNQQMSVLGANLTGTNFDQKGFLTEANTRISGEIVALAATGGNGVTLNKGDSFFRINLRINENVPLGTQIPIEIIDFSLVQEDDNRNLIEAFPTKEGGNISIQNESEFKVIDIEPISDTSLEIEFSDFVKDARIQDFTFEPNIVGPNTKITIEGQRVRFENLNSQIPNQEYRIEIGPDVSGNATGLISKGYDFVYFTGFPDKSLIASPFYITGTKAIDNNHFNISFSKNVNPLSVEQVDFDALNLAITEVKPTSDPKTLTVTTTDQSKLISFQECSATLAVGNLVDMSIVQTVNNNFARPGDVITFSLIYKNSTEASVPATNVKITNQIPSVFTVDTTTLPANCSLNPTTNMLSCSIGSVAIGGSGSISFSATVKNNANNGSITNLVSISTDSIEIDNSNNASSVDINILAVTDIYIQKIADRTIVGKNQPINFEVVFGNNGNKDVENVIIKNTISTGVVVDTSTLPTSATPSPATPNCTLNNNVINCDIGGTLPKATKGTFSYTASVFASGTINNTATIEGSNLNEIDTNNNTSTITIISTVSSGPDVYIKKISSTIPKNNSELVIFSAVASANDKIKYTIKYGNSGITDAENVRITDVVPSSLSIDVSSLQLASSNLANMPNCSFSSNNLTCNFSSPLAPSEKGEISFNTTVKNNISGIFTNNANITTTSNDLVNTNNSSAVSALIYSNVDLAITKRASRFLVKRGEIITFTIDYRNKSIDADATNVIIRDNLNNNFSNVSFLPTSATPSPATPNCTFDSIAKVVSCNIGGVLTAGQTGTLNYDVIVSQTASFGDIETTAEISSLETDLNQIDNADTNTIKVYNPSCQIDVNPRIIRYGASSTLSWFTTANGAKINQTIGNVAPGGTRTINPGANTTYTMTTDVIGNDIITISSISDVWNLKSTDGDILSLNTFPITPFGAEALIKNGPVVENVIAEKPNEVRITFKKNVFASSATAGDLSKIYSIYEIDTLGKKIGNNLVTSNTKATISADYRTVTLTETQTKVGKKYYLEINANTVQDFASGDRIVDFANTATFFGQASFFAPWDFAVDSVAVKNNSTIIITFTKEPLDESIKPTNFKILHWDGMRKNTLVVTKAEKNGNTVTLTTGAQDSNKLYYLIADPKNIYTTDNKPIGAKNAQGFFGYNTKMPKITAVNPSTVLTNKNTEIIIRGENFNSGSVIRINAIPLSIISISDSGKEIKASIPAGLDSGVYNLIIEDSTGITITMENAIVINKPETKLTVLSEESYASPYKVSNQNGQTRLWVRVEDPLGVSDIEKVTADLRPINGEPGALFDFGREEGDQYYDGRDIPRTSPIITDSRRWFFLDVEIPSTVPTSTTPIKIQIIAENKSGIKAFGTVEFMITRNLTSGIPPVIEQAYANPNTVAPREKTEISFYVVASDADGADNIDKVILDLGKIGLGTKFLQQPANSASSGDTTTQKTCAANDYIVGEWSACANSKQTRTVDLKSGANCKEDLSAKPLKEQNCTTKACTISDWIPDVWSECIEDKRTRSYKIKDGANCTGTDSRPPNDEESCTTASLFKSIIDIFVPNAYANSAGNKAWFEITGLILPDHIMSGVYELPLTVIDKEGEEAESTITLIVQTNNNSGPHIHKDDVYATPRRSAPNDGETTFVLNVKATDPNGPDDLLSLTANLLELGMPPISLTKSSIEGNGAWFHSDPLTIPRTINPGYRTISFTVTDKSGNYYTYDRFEFYVSDKLVEGDSPIVHIDKSYTTPRVGISDEKTKMTFYLFIEEGDADIESVNINLGNYAKQVGSSSVSRTSKLENYNKLIPIAFANDATTAPLNIPNDNTVLNNPIPSSSMFSDRIVSMKHSVSEGKKGHWYVLTDIVIDKNSEPSTEPYLLPVVVSDKNGNTTEAKFPLYVSDGTLPKANADLPFVQDVVATSNQTIEVLFSQSIDTKRINSKAFRIVETANRDIILPIKDINISADGRIVTIKTNTTNPNEYYTLIVDSEQLGLKSPTLTSNQIEFKTFSQSDYVGAPYVTRVEAKSTNEIVVTFSQKIKYSSVRLDGSNFTIYEKGGGAKYLGVKLVQFDKNGNSIVLSTENQKAQIQYILSAKNITNAAGITMRPERNKIFTGFVPKFGDIELFQRADFNGDGIIDFLDFTIFSSVYGKDANDESEALDLNNDGRIDFQDFTIFASNFGKSKDDLESEKNDLEPVDDTDFPDEILNQF